MSNAGPSAGHKRKAQNAPPLSSANTRKRQKFYDARSVSTQTADAALSRTGELNIASFIRAREFEINALDKSMKKARQSLSSRAFQQVPRHMRRRTASHNAKKVPRRLRGRARQEMHEDNTPVVNSKTRQPTARLRLRLETAKALKKITQKRKTVRQKKREAKLNAEQNDPSKHVEIVRIPRIKKNKLAEPPSATSKFKRRQVSKSWLPTHMWHTKRAHMTRPTEPLWRMTIPLRPTEKSYRATHKASESRGCVAWDVSYVSTIGCLGTATAIDGMLKALRFHGHGWIGSKYNKWKAGSRFARGWVCNRETGAALGLIDVLWCAVKLEQQAATENPDLKAPDVEMTNSGTSANPPKTKLDRKIMIRIHPSAFHQFWLELLKAAKAQKPQVLVEDLRFEIGSIQVIGPCSTEALLQTLKLSEADEITQRLWQALMPLSNPTLLPDCTMLHAKTRDPRTTHFSERATRVRSDTSDENLHEAMVDWPLDTSVRPSALFSHKARHIAGKLPSQWSLSRRREKLLPGQLLEPCIDDPSIPVILLAHRSEGAETTQQGTWTVLAPWKCIDVIWRKLLSCPLLSGSSPRFGGLYQTQQVAFEQRLPWFPGDFPGTEAGKAWERTQAVERFDAWMRRPPSQRIAWQSLDLGLGRRGELGRGWACDWEYLFSNSSSSGEQQSLTSKVISDMSNEIPSTSQPLLTQRQRKAAKAETEAKHNPQRRERNTSSPESDQGVESDLFQEPHFIQLPSSKIRSLMQHPTSTASLSVPALASVRITLLTKGTPISTARIYRLPASRPLGPKTRKAGRAHENTTSHKVLDATPPAAQMSQPNSMSSSGNLDLRIRWLSLDPREPPQNLSQRLKKDGRNHRGLSTKAQHHNVESLRHINVIPKNAPPEIHKQYGPQPVSEEERRLSIENDLAVRLEEQKIWEIHVPCPDAEDLIGFVTSGGYNLCSGKGTAVGGIWIQKVLRGWMDGDKDVGISHASGADAKTSTQHGAKAKQKKDQRQDRERHLCIIRNAGESIGRLALWELCE